MKTQSLGSKNKIRMTRGLLWRSGAAMMLILSISSIASADPESDFNRADENASQQAIRQIIEKAIRSKGFDTTDLEIKAPDPMAMGDGGTYYASNRTVACELPFLVVNDKMEFDPVTCFPAAGRPM